MKRTYQPDAVTIAACMWLLNGGEQGDYSGPDPGASHGLLPLLSRELGREEINLSSTAMWFRLEQIIRTVLERLAEEEVAVWTIKGFDLARSVYPFPGGRPMCDADLFIMEKDRQKIMGIFHRAGWSKGSPGDGIFTSGIVSEMKMFKHGVMAELHTHIFYFPATFPGKLPSDLFENGRMLEPGLMGFSWHNALLMVIIHLLTNVNIRPVWWVDICLLCMKINQTGTWINFAQNANRTKLGCAIAAVLATASSDLGAPVPERIVQALQNCSNERETILDQLVKGKKKPTLLNLKHLRGWKKVSWASALSWLILTGQQPLKRE